MEKDEITLELYKAHLKSKDAFIDRTFTLNRYYLFMVMILAVFGIKDLIDNGIYPMTAVPISVVGLVVSILWWINQDSYSQQINIKYKTIREKMEETFPYQPLSDEYAMMKEKISKRVLFAFPETQKYFSAAMIFVFVVMFICAFVPIVMRCFI